MEGWILTWKIVFILGLAIFTGMAVWVSIGGFKDIKTMLTRIDQHHKAKDEEED